MKKLILTALLLASFPAISAQNNCLLLQEKMDRFLLFKDALLRQTTYSRTIGTGLFWAKQYEEVNKIVKELRKEINKDCP